MLGGKGKEMPVGARFGAGVGADVIRVFNRALDLLSSNSADSENELLDLVKRAKRETEKDPFHLPKKSRSGRLPTELPASRSVSGPISSEQSGSQQPCIGVETSIGGTTVAATPTTSVTASKGHAQARLINVIRGGPGRGRIEKPKRKSAR